MKAFVRVSASALVVLLALCGIHGGRLEAQSTFGSIRGSTMDQTGAIIPGAQVNLRSLDENSQVATTSDSEGNFVFENLKPGHYSLTAAKQGFATALVDQIELAARQALRVDVKLSVAAQSLSVEVNASAVGVNTENATLSDSKENSDISQLPINSRTVSSSPLAALAVSPEVTRDSEGNIAVGGATAAQTGFSVDGISTASVRFNGALQFQERVLYRVQRRGSYCTGQQFSAQ